MIIKSLRLTNFRQYRNINLEFATDKNRPFTIILGDNTHGKTTLVNAFVWGLYGKNNFNDQALLNSDVVSEMKSDDTIKQVRSVIEFYHDCHDYELTTCIDYKKNFKGDVVALGDTYFNLIRTSKDRKTVTFTKKQDVKDEINAILQEDLSPFFFFDGEKNSIEKINKKRNLTSAVSSLMGIQSIEIIERYFNSTERDSVISRLTNERQSDDIFASEQLEEKIESIKSKISSSREEIEELEAENVKLSYQIDDKEEELNSMKSIIEIQNRKKELKQNLDTNNNRKNERAERILKKIQNNHLLYTSFSKSFQKSGFAGCICKYLDEQDNLFADINPTLIDGIIENKTCICGSKVEHDDNLYNRLMVIKESLCLSKNKVKIESFYNLENSNIGRARTSVGELSVDANELLEYIFEIDKDTEALRKCDEQLRDKTDTEVIQKSIESYKEQKTIKQANIDRIREREIEPAEKDLAEYRRKLEKIQTDSEENRFINRCIEYANQIYLEAKTKVVSERELVRSKLQDVVGEIFSNIYHGTREITIDSNFKTKTKTLEGNKLLDTSGGLEAVINFSFVAGLMNLAKNHIKERKESGDIFANGTSNPYPLVMDAPFSNTDAKHINKICSTLPKYCDQLIIIVMEKDFNTAIDTLRDKVGMKYSIIKNTETDGTIRKDVISNVE